MSAPDALKRISAARTLLLLDHPFFGALSLKLQPIESPRTETMATDGRHLFFSSTYVAGLKQAELVGLLAHECMHPAMLHHTRRAGRDAERWNIACDHAINPLLLDAGLTLPAGGCVDPAYKGLTAEQIYAKLPQQPPQDDGSGQQSGGGQGGGQPQPQDPAGQQGQPQQGQGAGGGSGQPNPLAQMPGAIFDAPPAEAAQEAADWQVAITQAAQSARMMGRLPAALAEAVEQAKKADTDWRAITARFAQSCAMSDYSWRRPNTRYLGMGLYLPQLKSEAMPPIVVAMDSSGSVSRDEYAAFAEHVALIADECLPERLYVIECDTKVQHVDEFERGERVRITQRRSGGGTDFRPVFDWIEREGIQPACVIYLTDGCGCFPGRPPEYPTLWALTADAQTPWGERVRVSA